MNSVVQIQIAKSRLALQKGGQGSGFFDHHGRPGERGGSAPDDGADPQLMKDAEAIAAMSEDQRDNTELSDFPGRGDAYNVYEAKKMMPKPSEKLKKVTDANSFSLWQNYDFIANVDGRHFGISKYEDPDDEEAFVYAYKPLDNRSGMRQTDNFDVRELFNAMRRKG